MKRFSFAVALLLCAATMFAQQTVTLKYANRQFTAKITVGGVELPMIWDTGAGHSTISEAVASQLRTAGLLTDNDKIDRREISLADGTIRMCDIVWLRNVAFYGIDMGTIEVAVLEGPDAQSLLGLDVIMALDPYEVRGQKLTIHRPERARQVLDSVYRHTYVEAMIARNNQEEALRGYAELEQLANLSSFETYDYAGMLYNNGDNAHAARLLSSITDYSFFEQAKLNLFILEGMVYYSMEQPEQAIAAYKRALAFPSADGMDRANAQLHLGLCYAYNDDHQQAAEAYRQTLVELARVKQVDYDYLMNDCLGRLPSGRVSVKDAWAERAALGYYDEASRAGIIGSADYFNAIADMLRAGNSTLASRVAPWIKQR